MKRNTLGLKKDIYISLEERFERELKTLPEPAYRFLRSSNEKIRTKIEYAKDLNLFFRFLTQEGIIKKENTTLIDAKDIRSLTVYDLEDFLEYLLEYTITYYSRSGNKVVQTFENGPHGLARKKATLSRFFKYLFKRDLIDIDITEKLEKIEVPNTQSIKPRLKLDELEILLDTILNDKGINSERELKFHRKLKFRDYIIVLILIYTGIRVGELVQLDIGDVYLRRQEIHVLRKGGNKEAVSLPEEIISDIAEYIEYRKKIKEAKTNALFLSLRNKRISDKTIREMLEKYQERSGIEVKLTPHLFRRTYGTKHYNDYKDMYLTAKVLGHDSAETTRKYYADPDEERVRSSQANFSLRRREKPSLNSQSNSDISVGQLKKISEKFGIPLEELIKNI